MIVQPGQYLVTAMAWLMQWIISLPKLKDGGTLSSTIQKVVSGNIPAQHTPHITLLLTDNEDKKRRLDKVLVRAKLVSSSLEVYRSSARADKNSYENNIGIVPISEDRSGSLDETTLGHKDGHKITIVKLDLPLERGWVVVPSKRIINRVLVSQNSEVIVKLFKPYLIACDTIKERTRVERVIVHEEPATILAYSTMAGGSEGKLRWKLPNLPPNAKAELVLS
ncbi:hypothetical protein DL96DRAFT_1561835 [Flagelloscypha sp. PMI_526]|nr:hypothetical protein DL96DRAFT_1561835 [Flagelloscypha sp. PMI_526]